MALQQRPPALNDRPNAEGHAILEGTRPPIFPPEIEREIFEVAARLYPKMAPVLLRVAHRVLVWIELILYETLISAGRHSSFQLALQSKPASFFTKNVRNMLVTTDRDADLLPICSSVIDLAIVSTNSVFKIRPHLTAMKLQRLCARLRDYSGAMIIDFTLPHFSSITHLDTRFTGDIPLAGLSWLPALTHLRLSETESNALHQILAHCRQLQVLVLIQLPLMSLAPICDELSIADPRFVLMNMIGWAKDWEVGTQGGKDEWARAELFIAKKRRGEIKPASRCWIETSDNI
ncbi:hypothetical protein DFH09DRAFT_1271973, partial [Mycena vulgaris]